MTARRRFEVLSYGQDEFKQTVFSDPFGSISWLGLRVPTLPTRTVATANGTPPWRNRYLFVGAAFSVADRARARIIGYRQYMTIMSPFLGSISEQVVTVPRRLQVTTPGWTFPDNVTTTWHFRQLGGPNAQGLRSFRPSNTTDLVNLRRGFNMSPALLYQSYTLPAGNAFYTDLTAYVPPNGGRPYGLPLTDDPRLSNVYGLQTSWRSPDAWGSLDVEVRGPATVVAFISVAQTNPTDRQDPTTGTGAAPFGIGIAPEDAFLANALDIWTAPAIVDTVGVSMVVETDSLESDVRTLVGGERKLG